MSNTILSNIKRTRTSFFEHGTNSNVFIYWWSNSNTLILTLNDQTSNFKHCLTYHFIQVLTSLDLFQQVWTSLNMFHSQCYLQRRRGKVWNAIEATSWLSSTVCCYSVVVEGGGLPLLGIVVIFGKTQVTHWYFFKMNWIIQYNTNWIDWWCSKINLCLKH